MTDAENRIEEEPMNDNPYTATCRVCGDKACCLFSPAELAKTHPTCGACRSSGNKERYDYNYAPADLWGAETEGGMKRGER